jgi:micrococcal nuclease
MRLTIFLAALFASIALTQAYYSGWFTTKSSPIRFMNTEAHAGESVSFNRCHIGGGYNCVVDGDTIWLSGKKVRIADIDAPETHDYGCPEEKSLGDRATARLKEVLESGPITLESINRDKDQYGRLLRIVLVNGESVGTTLVREGLARWYEGGRRPWC